ncbi:MAG: NfeD family protein [Solirubrobacteraceae bacterium MAG38_C4-C5]|nr:NfeD family protein [Candidatus Siliceabacter maunaloa]
MDAWVVFLIIAALLAVGEVLTLGFFLAPFAVGALAGMVAALIGAPLVLSFTLAIVVSVASFGVVRPIARRHRRTRPSLRTGVDKLIGEEAMVVQTVDNDANAGTVRLSGEVWTARAFDEEVIESGRRVHVVEIRGATALVSEL